MGIFSGMAKFGLGAFTDIEIIEDKKSSLSGDNNRTVSVEKKEEDALFVRKCQCPVCDLLFETKCVRSGKVKLERKDTDLRPIYEYMDPIKYDVIACDKCGYSSLTRYYGKLSNKQAKELWENVGKNFSGLNTDGDVYSYDDAIVRYKLALLCSVVKKSKNSERAYTCLKLAWVLRGKRETISSTDPMYSELYEEELECLKNAYDGFTRAVSSESMPIAGMDEYTITYILADLARRLKKYNDAVRLVGMLLTNKNVSKRIKDEAYKLKELIKADYKEVGGMPE